MSGEKDRFNHKQCSLRLSTAPVESNMNSSTGSDTILFNLKVCCSTRMQTLNCSDNNDDHECGGGGGASNGDNNTGDNGNDDNDKEGSKNDGDDSDSDESSNINRNPP